MLGARKRLKPGWEASGPPGYRCQGVSHEKSQFPSLFPAESG